MKTLISFSAVIISLSATASVAASDSQLEAIATIGELNGIALQCSYVDEVRRTKMALVRILPKKRELGVWFDKSTNDAFIQFMQQNESCPDRDRFSAQLDDAISALEKVYQ